MGRKRERWGPEMAHCSKPRGSWDSLVSLGKGFGGGGRVVC